MFQEKKEMEALSRNLERLIGGEYLGMAEVSRDTLPSKIQHQIIRLSDKIRGNEERIGREKDEIKKLIAEIAHQLRNPLANMEVYLEMLAEEEASEEERQFCIEAIAASEGRIRFLTEAFIRMARLESRIIQIKKESLYLRDTLLNSILQAKTLSEEKGIQIRLEAAEIKVPHDANWLGEAVYNLLDNSMKYSEKDSYIDVRAVQNEMFVQVVVRDYGIGIMEGEENLIFQRCYRGKRVTVQEGFGLGLYLSREIVLQHGGFVKARRMSPGLEIAVYLPVGERRR